MKTLAVLKYQRFDDSETDKTEPKRSKRQRFDKSDNKEGNNLDKDEGEIEGARYISPPFVFLPLFPQKVSNVPSDLGKGTRSLNHLVCIPKICYLRSANFALEFLDKRGLKAQKKNPY